MIFTTIEFGNNVVSIGNIAEWVAAIAAVATAILIFKQLSGLRQTVEYQISQVRSQTYQAVYSEMLSLDRFFFENWEFREYFYEGKEPPPDKKIQAGIVAELLCDLFDDVYHQRDTMPPNTFGEWQTYMLFLFDNSPTLRRAMESRQTWYPEDYRNYVLRKAD
jgi:hypothetical protein